MSRQPQLENFSKTICKIAFHSSRGASKRTVSREALVLKGCFAFASFLAQSPVSSVCSCWELQQSNGPHWEATLQFLQMKSCFWKISAAKRLKRPGNWL